MALRKELKEAFARDGKYVLEKVWEINVDDPHFMSGSQDITIVVTVHKRKRSKDKPQKFCY